MPQIRLTLTLLFVYTCICFGQSSSGTIQGIVTDTSHAVVPNAGVTVTNMETNVSRDSETNADGLYAVPLLQPGRYEVKVKGQGFSQAGKSNILLQVSDRLSIDFVLEVGAAATQVSISASTPLVNTSNPALGQVIENRRIIELPLDGREPISLAGLVPGVTPVPPNTNIHQGGAVPSINGASNFTSEVTIDGIPDTTPRNGGLNNFLVYTPTVDAVSEFRVETNSLSAEYGRFNGGVISIVMKSGTNLLHGSAYEFFRNSKMDANTFFNNRAGIPLGALKRNQFGFTLGGPVVIPHVYKGRDKTFFFVDYEGYRESLLSSGTFTVPTALQRQGDFSQTLNAAGQPVIIYDPQTLHTVNGVQVRDPFPGNVIPQNRLSGVALNLQKYYPLPNNSNLTANYITAPSVKYTNDTGDARLDHNFSDRNRLFGRYSIQYPFTGAANFYGNIGNFGPAPLTQRRYSFTLQDTYTLSPTLVLNLNYGLTRQFGTRTAWSDGLDVTTLGFAPNLHAAQQVQAIPPVTITGLSGIANGSQNYSTQLNNTVTGSLVKIAGRHTIKAGLDYRNYFINQLQNSQASGNLNFSNTFTQGPNPNQAGSTSGNAYAAFLLGLPSGSIAIQPAIASKSSYLAPYFQDDWRVSSKLTVNLGMRYDINFPRMERYNRVSIFDMNAVSPLSGLVPGYPGLRGAMRYANSDDRAYTRTDLNNFGPRVGFAYQLTPKMVIRSGYGIFYGLSPTDASGPGGGFTDGFTGSTSIISSLDSVTPVVSLANPFPNGINPAASRAQLNASTQLGQTVNSVNIGQATPYFQNWNFSVQRSVGNDLVLQAAYAGNKGTRLPFAGSINLNSLTADQIALGTVNNQLVANPFYGIITDPTSVLSQPTVTRGQLLKPFPQYMNLNAIYATLGNATYNSFQFSADKRFSHGFTVLVAFTAAKIINDTSQAASGQVIGSVQDPTNLRAERSIDPQDVSKRLVVSGVWELPVGRGRAFGSNMPRWQNAIVGGWQLNGIGTFQGGQPLVLSSIGAARPNVVGQPQQYDSAVQSRLTKYFDTSAYGVPLNFTYGNSSPTAPNLRSPGIANYDMSLFKNFNIVERMRAQFRIESFNLFNRVQFAAPGTQAGTAGFGVITGQQNTPREIQLALKLIF